jgi:excisionase family DNA binding protein
VKGSSSNPAIKPRRRAKTVSAPSSGPKLVEFPNLTNIPGRRGRRLLRTREACQVLGCGKDTLRTLIWDKELPIVRFHANGPWYIDVRDVERLIASHRAYFDGTCPEVEHHES